jgi:hypothetical protein
LRGAAACLRHRGRNGSASPASRRTLYILRYTFIRARQVRLTLGLRLELLGKHCLLQLRHPVLLACVLTLPIEACGGGRQGRR